MANEYAVNQADLKAVADAIRNKGGTSGALTFPGGFVNAVGAIEAGSAEVNIDGFFDGSYEGDITIYIRLGKGGKEFANFTRMGNYTITLPNLIQANASMFANSTIGRIVAPKLNIAHQDVFNSTKIPEINFPELTEAGQNCFRSCTASRVYLPKLTKITGQCPFAFMVNLEEIELPSLVTGDRLLFEGCEKLKKVDFGSGYSAMGAMIFQNCKNGPEAIILRSATVVSLNNVNSFSNTPFTGYNGTYKGHIYVPSALISAYQAATNWATLYAAYPDIFQPIEGSEYE